MKPKFRAWDRTRNEMNYKVMVGNCDTDDENWTCPIIGLKRKKIGYILMIMTLSCNQQDLVMSLAKNFLKEILSSGPIGTNLKIVVAQRLSLIKVCLSC